jgi:hypothetical protein
MMLEQTPKMGNSMAVPEPVDPFMTHRDLSNR